MTYPKTILTITIASYEDDGAQYTLIYPDGKTVLLGDAEDNYSELAGIIDDEYEKVTKVMFDYRHTHVSVIDGSTAMLVANLGDLSVLINEDGFAWADPRDQWEPIEIKEIMDLLEPVHKTHLHHNA